MVALKSLIFTVIAPGSVTILVPYVLLNSFGELFSVKIGNFRYLGLIPILLGTLIYFWCAWDFTFAGKGTPAPIDPPKELVVKGLYRFSRNPMYVGVLSVILGWTLLYTDPYVITYWFFVATCFHLMVVYYEEPRLQQLFGSRYSTYRSSVNRWLPRIR